MLSCLEKISLYLLTNDDIFDKENVLKYQLDNRYETSYNEKLFHSYKLPTLISTFEVNNKKVHLVQGSLSNIKNEELPLELYLSKIIKYRISMISNTIQNAMFDKE